jgi:2-dehydro-3-deoxyphosphogluconate aldolase/(4S)-4-hydroxy-2-oxoglutarate aldolase
MTIVQERIDSTGVIAIVRLADYSAAVDMARALLKGGISVVEFTYTNPQAGHAIEAVKEALGDSVSAGAGTVLDAETARGAILHGADFVVTPTVRVETIQACRRYNVPTVIGALTPTEILTAWEHGATFVKVFPASSVGPRYLKDVAGPLPQVPLIPTGGVNVDNAGDFIAAGARAVAVGGNLVDQATVEQARWEELVSRADSFVAAVAQARA